MASEPIFTELQVVAFPDFMSSSSTSVADWNKKELHPGILSSDQKSPTGPWGSSATNPTAPWGAPSPNAKSSASFWAQATLVVKGIDVTSTSNMSPVVKPNSFADIMSKELAIQLTKEEQLRQKSLPAEEDEDLLMAIKLSQEEFALTENWSTKDETTDDHLVAQMLQLEFDKAHDDHLTRHENRLNQNSKVTLSYRKFTSVHGEEAPVEDESDDETLLEEKLREPSLSFTRSNPGNSKSSLDIENSKKRKADRVMNFPPEFETGEWDPTTMRLSNTVCNDLKVHSYKEQKVSKKVRDKVDKSTTVMAVDARTRLMLYKLVNLGAVAEVQGTISTGKESVVIYAKGGQMKDRAVPSECAIKVFKTSLYEFKRREEYILGDHRLPSRGYKKQNPRKIIRLWAEKEMHNLNRMQRAGVHCPEVVALKKHVLVMSFVGTGREAAAKLKDVQLSSSQMEAAQKQTKEMMRTMYKSAGLVHGDLSEYNMLWHAGHVWFIDVSQAVELTHPHALQFLLRDCVNVAGFFRRQGLPSAVAAESLFNHVTEMNLEGEGGFFEEQVRDSQQSSEFVRQTHGPATKHQLLVGKEMAFDYFFDAAQKQREKDRRWEEETDSEESEGELKD